MKYYHFTINTGWGDTFWHLTHAIKHCIDYDKYLLIDFRGHWAGKKDSNMANNYIDRIESTNLKYTFCKSLIDRKKDVAEKHKDVFPKMDTSLKTDKDKLQFFNLFSKICFHCDINNDLEKYNNIFSYNYVIGVHARTSNGELLVDNGNQSNRFHDGGFSVEYMADMYKESIRNIFFHPKKGFLNKYFNYEILVFSDSERFVNSFIQDNSVGFKNHCSKTRRFFPAAGCGTGHEKGEKSDDHSEDLLRKHGMYDIAKEALVDFILLQRCNFLFKNYSRFNEFAIYSGIPHVHMKFQQKCY